MGAAVSTSILASTLNDATAINSAIDQAACEATNIGSSSTNINNFGPGCVITAGSKIFQSANSRMSCLSTQAASIDTTALKNIQENLAAAAKGTVSGIPNFMIGVSTAVNSAITNLSTAINETTYQKCGIATTMGSPALNINNCTGATLESTYVNQQAVSDTVISCLQQASSVASATDNVALALSVSSDASNSGLFGGITGLIIIVIIIVIVIGVFKTATNPNTGKNIQAATGAAGGSMPKPSAGPSMPKPV